MNTTQLSRETQLNELDISVKQCKHMNKVLKAVGLVLGAFIAYIIIDVLIDVAIGNLFAIVL
jgi:hypothetical protein